MEYVSEQGINQYAEENGEDVHLNQLKADLMDKKSYSNANASLVMACHDVFIKYQDGILLVKRSVEPAVNTPWPIGGRISRGFSTEDSLKNKAFKECGLVLKNIQYLGTARVMLATDPFGHGKGTDAIAVVYIAEGHGELKLDDNHSGAVIIKKETYHTIRQGLHAYVREYMDMMMTKM